MYRIMRALNLKLNVCLRGIDEKFMDNLFHQLSERREYAGSKVTVVGCGQVGMAAVFAMFTQGVTNNIALVDMDEKKIKGEMMDIKHGSSFLRNIKLVASTDYAVTAGSKVCIITAGVRQKEAESRLDLVQRNTDVLKKIIPQLIKHSPDAVLLVASNPVDTLSYVSWKLSGLPRGRVLGSGTNLDSARFRYLVSEQLGIGPTSCHAYIIGEHGDSSVPVWSTLNIAGVRLSELVPEIGTEKDSSDWNKLHQQVVNSAYEVIKLKGYTSWAIGLSLAQLTNAVLTNANTVHPVSTIVQGNYNIEEEVFLSLPCVVGADGVSAIVRQTLTAQERDKLRHSAALMAKIQSSLHL